MCTDTATCSEACSLYKRNTAFKLEHALFNAQSGQSS